MFSEWVRRYFCHTGRTANERKVLKGSPVFKRWVWMCFHEGHWRHIFVFKGFIKNKYDADLRQFFFCRGWSWKRKERAKRKKRKKSHRRRGYCKLATLDWHSSCTFLFNYFILSPCVSSFNFRLRMKKPNYERYVSLKWYFYSWLLWMTDLFQIMYMLWVKRFQLRLNFNFLCLLTLTIHN